MPYIEIDTRSEIPIYAQIMDSVRALIRAGELVDDDLLPSVRQLAADLEVNPNTVAKAYSLLEREGIVETRRRKGTVVASSARSAAQRSVDSRLQEAVDRVLEETAGLGVGLDEILKTLERRSRSRGRTRSQPRSDSTSDQGTRRTRHKRGKK
jgi:GntR family transcriptional regulator